MYESFFNLREKPFSLNPDPEYLYQSRRHQAALTMLEYGLAGQAGFVVLTGEVGSGKTTLIRHFLRRANDEATVGVITNTHESLGDLMQWIAFAFGLESGKKDKVELYADFMNFVRNIYQNGSRVILVVDEAQNMSVETLEELRMLSNINVEKDMMLQTILVGQPELLEKLSRPELAQFAQRVAIDYHLTRLSYQETRAYIRHRLQVAGGSPDLFNIEAIGGIFYFSNGIPRVINTLCDSALVYAFADEKYQVDVATILAVAADRRTGLMKSIGEQYKDIDRMSLQAALQRFASYENDELSNPTEPFELDMDPRRERDVEPRREREIEREPTDGRSEASHRIPEPTRSMTSIEEKNSATEAADGHDPAHDTKSIWNRRSFQNGKIGKEPTTNTAQRMVRLPTPRPMTGPTLSEPTLKPLADADDPPVAKIPFGREPIISPPHVEPARSRRPKRWWRFRL